MKKQILDIIIKYRVVIISLIILWFFGYTLWHIRAISNPAADPDYVSSRRGSTLLTHLQIKDEVRAQIEKLQPNKVDVKPGKLGTSDPFSP